jgi:hypothetical protein
MLIGFDEIYPRLVYRNSYKSRSSTLSLTFSSFMKYDDLEENMSVFCASRLVFEPRTRSKQKASKVVLVSITLGTSGKCDRRELHRR